MKTRYFVVISSMGHKAFWKITGKKIEYSYKNSSWSKSCYKTLEQLKLQEEDAKEITPEELALM